MKITPDKTSYKILLNSGKLPKDQLDLALQKAEQEGISFIQSLLNSGFLQEPALLDVFSQATGSPVVNLKKIQPDPSIFERVPVKFPSYYKFFPVRYENGKLFIAVSQILDIHTLDEIRFALGFDIGVCFALRKDIEDMLNKYYGLAAGTVDKILVEASSENKPAPLMTSHEIEDIEKLAATPSVANVVNQIILDACRKRASDIHLEALASGIRLRYRIDGILKEAPVPKELKEFFSPMLSRIKIMANLNVAEKRLPQDGKMRVKTQKGTIDLRVSFIPTANGESVVIRILSGKNVFKLEQLGFEQQNCKLFKELLARPNGIIFVTGPTGSGKSTTLYAALNHLNSPERKIITIEDPVEYELEGINQIHVAPDIGLNFSSGLRSMLRQDPDIMMVGEVRDFETAEIAIRAALTGHLILSTLHTNDAASGITRLLDIGVEAYLVASSVIVFIAQRLVRVICPQCRIEDTEISELKSVIQKECYLPYERIHVYKGRGCEACNNTGYRGRVAIQEFLVINESIRQLVMNRASAEMIQREAIKQGMVTLRQDGWRKVLSGVTTPEEILEATEESQLPMSSQVFLEDEAKEHFASIQNKDYISGEVKPDHVLSQDGQSDSKKQESSDKAFVNLRKYQRVQCHLSIICRLVECRNSLPAVQKKGENLSQIEFEGIVENISPGGVLFNVQNQILSEDLNEENTEKISAKIWIGDILEAGNLFDLKIHIPEEEKPVECMAKILRVTRSTETTSNESRFSYLISGLFLAIHSIDRNRLEKFCTQHQSDETV